MNKKYKYISRLVLLIIIFGVIVLPLFLIKNKEPNFIIIFLPHSLIVIIFLYVWVMSLIAIILRIVKCGRKCEYFMNTIITLGLLIIFPPVGIILVIILKIKLRKMNNEKKAKNN